ncbi:MAG TPA: hypothetical protein VLD67_09095 [Vicinamibacterales bacterium]|nr:hypothetical protein [Vicinamibacterales bacterium]
MDRHLVRRHVTASIVATVCVMFSATPASAQDGFWRWLERLSGPGPYHGWGVSVTPLCFGVVKKDRLAADPDRGGPVEPFLDIGCGKASRNDFRAMLRFEFAWLGADDNKLEYDGDRTRDELKTNAFSFIPAVDFGVTRWLEIGAGMGFIRFTGDAFDSFSKPAIQPLRVRAKPLLFRRNLPTEQKLAYPLEFLQIEYVVTLIPDGFEAQDFGAVPGTFSTGTEFLSSVSVVVDAVALFHLFKGR